MAALFTPLTIRGHVLNNRIVLPPMANNMALDRGEVTNTHIEHYVRRAKAGVGDAGEPGLGSVCSCYTGLYN